MSNLNLVDYNIREKGFGGINGSVINIEYGDKVEYVDLVLLHASSKEQVSTELGRCVTCAIWVIDSSFSFDKISYKNAIYCQSIESRNGLSASSVVNIISHGVTHPYVDTNVIPFIGKSNAYQTFRFKFNTDTMEPIKSTRIFVGLLSTENNISNTWSDSLRGTLAYKIDKSGTLYYTTSPDITQEAKLLHVNTGALYIGDSKVIHLSESEDDTTNIGSTSQPAKVECSEIKYRTWSQQLTYPNGQNFANDGWYDGGETYGYFKDSSGKPVKTLDATSAPEAYIHNENNSFHSEFGIKQGRLRDVYFGKPELGEYPSGTDNSEVVKPRWVFKRSRIMFTIPPIKNKSGKIINKAVKIRYRVKTDLPDLASGAYANDYKYKTYTLKESTNPEGINIVICPRDEGVQDNQAFSIAFSRAYNGSNTYSDENIYQFHTYQKPVVNIAYPKAIRNEATGLGDRHASIIASNMYSNFKGENEILNKYVCDAMTVLIASSLSDNSGIPMFVRFWIGEYKFGRTGLLNAEGNPEYGENDTSLAKFYSKDINDYTSIDYLRNGKVNFDGHPDPTPNQAVKMTANVTGIYKADGAPLLLCGRYAAPDLEQIGRENKIWTYRTWDYVCSDELNEDGSYKDVMVGNAWPISYELPEEERYFEAETHETTDGTVIVKLPDWLSVRNYHECNNKITFTAKHNGGSEAFRDVKIVIVDHLGECDSGITGDDGIVRLPTSVSKYDETQYTLEEGNTFSYDSGKHSMVSESHDISIEYKLPLEVFITKHVVPDHWGASKTLTTDSKNRPSTYEQSTSKQLLFRAGYIYLLRMRMFHGAAAGAIGVKGDGSQQNLFGTSIKYGGITNDDVNSFVFGFAANSTIIDLNNPEKSNIQNSGFYYGEGGTYGGTYPFNDSSQHGVLTPYATTTGRWVGPDDGTSSVPINFIEKDPAEIDENMKTYPGFSKIDYSFFQPVSPYTSLSNLITVHPSSSQITANQWLSFNYRHLAKNIGAIENGAKAPGSEEVDVFNPNTQVMQMKTDCFGKTIGGVDNVVSRVMDMYTTCVETAIWSFDRWIHDDDGFKDGTNLNTRTPKTYTKYGIGGNRTGWEIDDERMTIYIKSIKNRDGYETDDYVYTSATTSDLDAVENEPLVAMFPIKNELYVGKKVNGSDEDYNSLFAYMADMLFYNPRCGLFWYNMYRKPPYQKAEEGKAPRSYDYGATPSAESTNYIKTNTRPFDYLKLYKEKHKEETGQDYVMEYVEEGSGNTVPKSTYFETWPEMHAIYKAFKDKPESTETKRIQYDEPHGNTYRWQPVINALASNTQEIQIQGKQTNVDKLPVRDYTLYSEKNPKKIPNVKNENISYTYIDYIQEDYFYKETSTINPTDMVCNETTRFTIQEFAGTPVKGGDFSSGWPAMYTTCNAKNPVYPQLGFVRYFTINKDAEKSYGKLFLRVPTTQDCENGKITAFLDDKTGYTHDMKTIGGIVKKNENDSLNVEGLHGAVTNIYPLTRTTHYLYFKSFINTSLVMRLDVRFKYTDEETGETEYSDYYTAYVQNTGSELKLVSHLADNEASFTFGGDFGCAEVYAEDNNGWGRCLSADDYYARPILWDGTTNGKSPSGGIEVPILVRYTPLLQPRIAVEAVLANGEYKTWTGGGSSHSTTIKWVRTHESSTGECDEDLCLQAFENWDHMEPRIQYSGGGGGGGTRNELIETTNYDINIFYPFIPENNSYYTTSPNGGVGGNICFKDYYIDVDSDASKNLAGLTDEGSAIAQNKDSLGGYGICTGYTVLLVPSDPDLSGVSDSDKKYFTNSDGHWNYFKQPVNYYTKPDIFKVRSLSIPDAGPVVVKWNVQADTTLINPVDKSKTFTNKLNYTEDGIEMPDWWQTIAPEVNKGRAYKTINVNFKELLSGDFATDITTDVAKLKTDLGLTEANKLKIGLQYDLVIIPLYCNSYNKNHCYIDGGGTINGEPFGRKSDETKNESQTVVTFAGSNPFVCYNYLFISKEVLSSGTGGGGGGGSTSAKPYDTNYQTEYLPCSNCNIGSGDHAIIFPNVDNELFNNENGVIKECPGFWLNNSFRLVLRMPAFKLKSEALSDTDFNTLENASNGILNSNDNTSDDFEFEDIQIHIGKISELEKYGWPYNMEDNLNKLTSKYDLAKAHIISYKHYANRDVFSKRLYNNTGGGAEEDYDRRDKLTGGALNPDDPNYSHRFVEVNLSNAEILDDNGNYVPIYTTYPEGYYIQFRWKSPYGGGNDTTEWSDWHGGSVNGGKNWWGDKGLNYYVPVRNFNNIYTEFRHYIKESYPGSITNPSNVSGSEKVIGEGTSSTLGSVNEISQTNPLNAASPSYYMQGEGNEKSNTMIAPSLKTKFKIENNELKFPSSDDTNQNSQNNITRNLESNNDDPYNIMYAITHDTNFKIPENISNLNQHMWEMEYVDYIIRNMCKLYYKPKHNEVYTANFNGKSYKTCKLAAPKDLLLNYKTWGWDDSEYPIFDSEYAKKYNADTTSNNKTDDEDKSSKDNHINGPRTQGPQPDIEHLNSKTSNLDMTGTIPNLKHDRQQWDRNKYYRKIITKQDFDELNKHLEELQDFINDEKIAGKYVPTGAYGNRFVLLPEDDYNLEFERSRRMLIGNCVDDSSGSPITNNINHTMMSSNYIQNLWENILLIHKTNDGNSPVYR